MSSVSMTGHKDATGSHLSARRGRQTGTMIWIIYGDWTLSGLLTRTHTHTRCLEVEDYDLLMSGTILKYSSAVSQFHRMSSYRTWDCMSSIEPREAILPLNCVSDYKPFLILKPECVWVSTSSSPLSRRINTGAPSFLINNLEQHTQQKSLSLAL